MKIAIWTTRAPKVDWIKKWVSECPYFDWVNVEYILESVPSDISDMPLSIEETMLWAKNRAGNLKKAWIIADFYIWIEWWTTEIWDKKYIWWIVYIEDNSGKWHYGFSPMMEVPSKVEKMLYIDWLELGPVMWELSWKTDIRSENGSMWAWSNDMLTREAEFTSAFKAAISPFFNDYYKM